MSCVYRDLAEKLMHQVRYVLRRMIFLIRTFCISFTVQVNISVVAGRTGENCSQADGLAKNDYKNFVSANSYAQCSAGVTEKHCE